MPINNLFKSYGTFQIRSILFTFPLFCDSVQCAHVLRIHDILGWIRIRIWIRGSMPRTNGSGSCFFRHWPSQDAYYFLKVHIHHFQSYKVKKKSQSSRNQGFSYFSCLVIEGSRRLKNMWIRWIRIRNTDLRYGTLKDLVSGIRSDQITNNKGSWSGSSNLKFDKRTPEPVLEHHEGSMRIYADPVPQHCYHPNYPAHSFKNVWWRPLRLFSL